MAKRMLPDITSLSTFARDSPMPMQLNGRTIVNGRPYCSCAPCAKNSVASFWNPYVDCGGGETALLLRQRLVGELIKEGDSADDGRPGDEGVAPGEEVLHQGHLLGIAAHEPVTGMVVEAAPHLAVLRVVVDPKDLVSGPQQLVDQVSGDESGRARNEDVHESSAPFPKKFQMSITFLSAGMRRAR